MNILHVLLTVIPVPPIGYGGTERVLWSLYQGQIELGCNVRFLLKKNVNNNPNVLVYDESKSFEEQIDDWPDIVHFHFPYEGELHKPFVCTEHGNSGGVKEFPINTIYLSRKHAENHNAQCYVHNGLYWADYGKPNLEITDKYIHFLAKASWPIKNLQGAVRVAQGAKTPLSVLGGKRFNIKRNPYAYFSKNITFHGMVGGERKMNLIRNSKGLIFPVLWDEPFGLAVIESLYLGCPVFATPFGSLPDIITNNEIGFLSQNYDELIEAIKHIDMYDRYACHRHAKINFNHQAMSKSYHECYERVISGEALNLNRPHSESNLRVKKSMSTN